MSSGAHPCFGIPGLSNLNKHRTCCLGGIVSAPKLYGGFAGLLLLLIVTAAASGLLSGLVALPTAERLLPPPGYVRSTYRGVPNPLSTSGISGSAFFVRQSRFRSMQPRYINIYTNALIAGNRMNPVRLDRGWHTQFVTKFPKRNGFGGLGAMRVCSR